MLAKTSFKKSTLSLSVSSILQWNDTQRRFCMSIFLSACATSLYANTAAPTQTQSVANPSQTDLTQQKNDTLASTSQTTQKLPVESPVTQADFDSWNMLESLLMNPAQASMADIQLPEELQDVEVPTLSAHDAEDTQQVANEAKQAAEQYSKAPSTGIQVQQATSSELAEINSSPIEIEQLAQSLAQDGQQIVSNSLKEPQSTAVSSDTFNEDLQPASQSGLFGRLWQRIRPNSEEVVERIPKISAVVEWVNVPAEPNVSQKDYEEALDDLKDNIKAKLSTISQEAFADAVAVAPQLKTLSSQAANAVGFYQAEFQFEHVNDRQVRVKVKPNNVVLVRSQNIEFTGPDEGVNHPRFQVISVLPDLEEGDVFHHGTYMQTKTKIETAASDNGFFDSFWRLHDVKIDQPDNLADINLKFETGQRYRLSKPEFKMSDPSKSLPLRKEILEKLIPWQQGDDYTAWRINLLANNLTNSRYFNYTLVDAIHPDPLDAQLELAPDIEALLEEYNLNRTDVYPETAKKITPEVDPTVNFENFEEEQQFAGVDNQTGTNTELEKARAIRNEREAERKRLQKEARLKHEIPVHVTLNADKLNTAELGAGFGTDTGPRVRGQYRRAIVNDRGHSFDANMEVSEIRQAIDARYNIPYHHPLNDYVAIVGGYEREERDDVAQGSGISIQSLVVGADRIIKNPRGSWQRSFGVRYRLDQLELDGDVSDIPVAFAGGRSDKQQSLLFGYEVSRTDTNRRVNPTKGFKQTYKVEVGSESLLTDVDMAILNASWNALYSLDAEGAAKHQFVGRADVGYIFSEDFNKVPYNLRYFSGGDQSIRGFDYKSLSPEVDGYKVGGQANAVASLEYNYQFIENWRAAVFADAGNAYNEDFSNDTEYGVGLGVRWASPIGPVRIDVASGISDPGKPIRVHFFIGSSL